MRSEGERYRNSLNEYLDCPPILQQRICQELERSIWFVSEQIFATCCARNGLHCRLLRRVIDNVSEFLREVEENVQQESIGECNHFYKIKLSKLKIKLRKLFTDLEMILRYDF